ncbi:aldehyde dehydrogenase [Streptomyces griseiscabiei]|uniref:Aldehyde dehydrogenase n=1 Tax=Streptomyces griseiscabiei TaxID=2993540 RepID=A0ABU4L6P1_9ACTN|nr:aldehyde dehydrogenase [Streptomyces griseiscabiei]MBZ3906374.1 aldehyde dehydrogenase [Streptomyces griseiscabiei]MDX2911372.1 aldehyde dehydrogenase [Streptomyces griseiscabiei]
MQRYEMFIDGESRKAAGGEWFPTDNPYLGTPWAEIAKGTERDVDDAVRAAHRALHSGPWAELTASARGALLRRLGDTIAANARRLAETEVRDNGKLFTEMHGQVGYVPQWFHYYGGLADKVEGTVPPLDKKGYFAYTKKEPVGVVAVITPWNSPLLLLAWKIAPALAAGCTVVIKPSEFTSASTLELVRLLHEAGLPPGVVNVVTGFGRDVGATLVEHPLVRKVTFTGSDATGRHINQAAARDFKHVSLELGGKSPNVVFADADLGAAVNGAVSGIFAATGQTCIAGSRLLVQESVHDEVVDRLVDLARMARTGDPMDEATQVGPITTPAQYAKVLDYIDIAQGEGARLALGGRPVGGQGWFVEPTVFTGVRNSMRIAQEEVFGPVLAVIPFKDEDEAVTLANDSRYGLGAGVWTGDIGRAFRMADRIRSGTVWVNTYRAVSYLAPFGGFKDSGIGRENGIGAITSYLEDKSVWINTGAPAGNPFVLR